MQWKYYLPLGHSGFPSTNAQQRITVMYIAFFFLVINEIPCDMNFYVKFQFLVVGDIFLVLLPRIYFTAPLVTSDLHSSKLDFYDRSDGFMILGCYIFDDDNASFGFQRD